MNNLANGKTVNLELVGLDGNAFSLMGAFQRQARKEKWTAEEIRVVLDEARAGDYDHLLSTLIAHTEAGPQEGCQVCDRGLAPDEEEVCAECEDELED